MTWLEASTLIDMVLASSQIYVVGGFYPETSSPVTHGTGFQPELGVVCSISLELVGEDLVPVQQGGKSYSLMGTEVGEGYRGLVIRNGKKVIQNR